MSEMQLVGIRVELPQQQPVMLLQEADGERILPIWIGQHEAAAIAMVQQGVEPARPLTHDLLVTVFQALGRELVRVDIVDLREGTFYADLVFDDETVISARPSDAVAVAVRCQAPIHAAAAVLDEAGIIVPEEQDEEVEVERFKEFLDSVSPEDFEAGES